MTNLRGYYLHVVPLHVHVSISPGLQVIEVAHDMQLAVRRYLKQELNLVNSFDTWHGMKLTVMVFSQDV